LKEAMERTATGCDATPVPVSETDCGKLEAVAVALPATLSDAAMAPPAAGLNVTEMAQEALTASDEPQVLV